MKFLNKKNIEEWKHRFLFVEIFVGVLSVILGGVLTWLVRGTGYYPGALTLMVTGSLTIVLSFKEWKHLTPAAEKLHVMNLFFTILRRAFFFLNLMLSALIVGTFTNMV